MSPGEMEQKSLRACYCYDKMDDVVEERNKHSSFSFHAGLCFFSSLYFHRIFN